MSTALPVLRRSGARASGRGVTLIEVLIGIAIGLIGMLVMFQMVTVWDARTRASTSTGDAQVAGTIAIFNIERDLRLAGMGFGTALTAETGCSVKTYDQVVGVDRSFPLQPISIVDGGNGPDTIQALYGNSPFFVQTEQFNSGTADSFSATIKYGFKRGDLAVMTNGGSNCRLLEITDDSTPGPHILSFGTAAYTSYYTGQPVAQVRYNPLTAPLPISSGNLYSLGNAPKLNSWSVDTTKSSLQFQNLLPVDANVDPRGIAEGVVNMKAEYGYDSNGDNNISDNEWIKTLPVPTDWTKVRAVRIGLLVRSREFAQTRAEPGAPAYKLLSANAPKWSGSTNSPFVMKNVDGTTDSDPPDSPNNWRYYRYRVFEKVIPLRNMMWGQT